MFSARTDRPALSEMRCIGQLLETLVNSDWATSSRASDAIGAQGNGNVGAREIDSARDGYSGEPRQAAALGEGAAITFPPPGVSVETWRALVPHLKHVVRELGALQLRSRALTELAEHEKELCAVVLLPGKRGVPPRLLASSGVMKVLLASDQEDGRKNGVTERFLEGCRQAYVRADEQVQWRASDGMDYRLSVVKTVKLPGCEMILVNLTHVSLNQATINQCRQVGRARGLTRRQVEILELLSCGLGNREIAHRLRISYHTARAHVRDIFAKLSVSNRIEAINAVRPPPANPSPVGAPTRTSLANGR